MRSALLFALGYASAMGTVVIAYCLGAVLERNRMDGRGCETGERDHLTAANGGHLYCWCGLCHCLEDQMIQAETKQKQAMKGAQETL